MPVFWFVAVCGGLWCVAKTLVFVLGVLGDRSRRKTWPVGSARPPIPKTINPRVPSPTSRPSVIGHGASNEAMICPHCLTKGRVFTKPIRRKAGISGAKATGALLTGGISLLAVGLSRKDRMTECYCDQCTIVWTV